MRRALTRLAVPAALAALVAPLSRPVMAAAVKAAFPAECPWMDTSKSPGERASVLLAASSLEQELRWLVEQPANQPATTTFSGGVTYPAQLPCTPNVTYTDGPDSVRGSTGVTTFPAQIGLAASWSRSLAYAKGKAQADEAFRKGKNVVLGPGLAGGRTPLLGRTPEYLGEDALLGGSIAAAHVNGLQTGNPGAPVMAVLKHYVANEQELDRQLSSSNMDERTFREVYDLPFEVALGQSDPGGIMCSYNQINGVYACENPLLKTALKDSLGFDGYVVSDFGAVHSTAPSLVAGLDQELNRPNFWTPDKVKAALDAGQITRPQIDEAAFRVVRAYIKAGLFDHPVPAPEAVVSNDANKAVSLAIATQGSVLLKNQSRILPLPRGVKKIAVIGPTASNTPTNGVSAQTVCGERGFGAGSCSLTPVAPLDAITQRAAAAGATVTFDNGADLASAAVAAKAADVAVVFGYATMGEGSDRTALSLDGGGDALIAAVAAANRDTVVVLETGTAVVMPWLNDVKGVLEAWYPGDQQGTAIARLLYGDDNPSGRLPLTFPRAQTDLPARTPEQYPGVFADGTTTRPAGDRTSIRQVSYSEGLAVGYKWYDDQRIAPLFPFGFGLSYTTFAYDDLHTDLSRNRLKINFRVRNTGLRTGVETSQVYLTFPAAAGEPGNRLIAFEPSALRPGESRKVKLEVRLDAADHPMSVWDATSHAWVTPAGRYTVRVGSSSRDLPLADTIKR
ncbi:glycoside hydrolase family 3 C-terminal domain-containing protein [Streptosporangiaceae bacterium NEAU-GS5]|nr:glycoside hydrolase family 3 C-terminal domain-containing protein [Streptosporangiaceae bacterium NEAU-GS5]